MTRETKVGLVVASSFVCLVGVVVASRLGRNAALTASPPNPPFVNNSQPPENPGDEKSNPKKQIADKKVEHVAGAHANGSHADPLPPAVGSPEHLPAVPPLDFNAVANGAAPLIPPDPNHLSSPDKIASPGPQVAKDKETKDLLIEQKKRAEHAGLDTAHDMTPSSAAFPLNNQSQAMLQPGQEAMKPEPPLPSVSPPSATFQEQNVAPKPAPPPPPPPAQDINLPTPPSGEQKPSAPNNLPAMNNPAPQPAKLDFSAKDVTRPNMPPMGFEKPPVPQQPFQAVPPAANTLPKVNDFTPKTYICQEGDSSFEALSTRFYNSPKYARALQQLNKEHPLHRPNVLEDNPRLSVGQPIFYQPKEFLEKNFAPYIASASSPAATQPQVPIGINPPVTSSVGGQATSLPTIGRQPVSVQSTDPTRKYRVPQQGQLLAEIAQQQLGDHRRWTEIYRLNSNLHPEVPIPGGTDIVLPVAAP